MSSVRFYPIMFY